MGLWSKKLEHNKSRRTLEKPLFSYGYYILMYLGASFMGAGLVWFFTTISSMDWSIITNSLNNDVYNFKVRAWTIFGLLIYIAPVCGVLNFVLYLRIARINNFIERKKHFYETVCQFTEQYSENSQKTYKLKAMISGELPFTIKPIPIIASLAVNIFLIYSGYFTYVSLLSNELALYFLFSFLCLGLYIAALFLYLISMNNFWYKIQQFDMRFQTTLGEIWKSNDWIDQPFHTNYYFIRPEREYIAWCFYSIVSCGIMGIVWDYKIHTDPDDMLFNFYSFEDEQLEIMKKIEDQQIAQSNVEI